MEPPPAPGRGKHPNRSRADTPVVKKSQRFYIDTYLDSSIYCRSPAARLPHKFTQ